MRKKALVVASVASMIDQFNMPNINLLQERGYEVHVACNFIKSGNMTSDNTKRLIKRLESMQVVRHQIDFNRNPFYLKDTIKAYRKLREIMKLKFSIVHSHSPVGGALARIAAGKYRKSGLKSIYTAHGFHFFKGSSKLNWILYFPVEKLLSKVTDVLITINTEDYKLAKRNFHMKEIRKIPGVGLDIDTFKPVQLDSGYKTRICKSLNIPENSFLILSVGELNKNKNHEVIIEAISKIKYNDIHYLICGMGELKDDLIQLAIKLGVESRISFLGFRNDIDLLNRIVDVFAFPSYREGLGMAALEAMASGLPIITSNVHGINDYSKDGVTGFSCNPNSVECFTKSIKRLYEDEDLREIYGRNNVEVAEKFSNTRVDTLMNLVYLSVEGDE